MPATASDKSQFSEGDLNQELIDQMLNGGDVGGTAQPDPWADDALQAEIDAARATAGSGGGTPTPISSLADRAMAPAPSAQMPTAVPPSHFMPLTPQLPSIGQGHRVELLM